MLLSRSPCLRSRPPSPNSQSALALAFAALPFTVSALEYPIGVPQRCAGMFTVAYELDSPTLARVDGKN